MISLFVCYSLLNNFANFGVIESLKHRKSAASVKVDLIIRAIILNHLEGVGLNHLKIDQMYVDRMWLKERVD